MEKFRITASRCKELMSNGRGKEIKLGDTVYAYAREIVLQEMGFEIPDVVTDAMEWGLEYESDARDVYIRSRNAVVELPGFIIDPTDDDVGCTPDGVVDGLGTLEIKCPQWREYSRIFFADSVPTDYLPQIQFQLMVTGLGWCDFMIFHPEMPDGMKAKVFRVERDEEYINRVRARIVEFKEVLKEYRSKLGKDVQ